MTNKAVRALLTAALAFGLSAVGASSQPDDHLWPAFGGVNRYDDSKIVAVVYRDAFAANVRVRMRTRSAFPSTDTMTFIQERHGKYNVVHLQTNLLLLEYAEGPRAFNPKLPIGYPPDYRTIRPDRCEIEIPPDIAMAAIAAWRGVLLRTTYDEKPRRGMDGGTAEFSMYDGVQQLYGWIWSPEDRSMPGRLWQIGDMLGQLCVTHDQKLIPKLDAQISNLRERLQHTR